MKEYLNELNISKINMNYQYPRLIKDVITNLDSRNFLEVHFVMDEDVQGFFQLQSPNFENIYEECEIMWDEIDEWETELGEYVPGEPVFEGDFVLRTTHHINVDWLRTMINKFIESGQRFEDETEPLYLWEFFEFGKSENLFDIQSETGLFGKGHSFKSYEKTYKLDIITHNGEQIKVAKIYGVDSEECSIRFLLKD